MRHSIRARTLAVVLGVLTITLLVISWRSYRDAQHEIEELFDAQLAQSARLLEGMVGESLAPETLATLQSALDRAKHIDSRYRPEKDADGHRYEAKLAFQILDAEGHLLLQSASAPPRLLENLKTALQNSSESEESLHDQLTGYHDIALNGTRWRVFLRHDEPLRYWILVAERGDVRGELVQSITLRSLLPDAIGLPILALLVWLAIGVGLRPLQQMTVSIKARDAENLSPLDVPQLPLELEPIIGELNRLLRQITDLIEREKRFIADAAHELRTPLAVLRIHAQNALAAQHPAERDEALRHLVGGVERSTRVVTQLLTLARLEPDALRGRMMAFDMASWLRAELAEIIPLSFERDQELSCELEENADYHLTADAPSLDALLQNLVGNAMQYTPAGGQIVVSLLGEAQRIGLRVADSGPGVPEAERALLFRRFYRLSEGGQGAGLGLSIVQRVVELHSGHICLGQSAALGGLEVTVWLPRQR